MASTTRKATTSTAVAVTPAPGLGQFPPEIIAELMDAVQEQKRQGTEPSPEEKQRAAISAMLRHLGGMSVQEDALRFEGDAFILPGQYKGKVDEAIRFLYDYQKQQEHRHKHNRTMPYRPYDGAHAFMEVMRQITGTTGFGVTKMTFFGPIHPEFITINTSDNTTTQVPWGTVAFPSFEAEFEIGYIHDPEKGYIFQLICLAPRKYRMEIEAVYGLVEQYLKDHSIYRGHAINGASPHPEFIKLDVDPDSVVYSQDVLDQLSANVWAPIEYTEVHRDLGLPIKRAVLFAGPWGTGKTLGVMITAQKAVKEGWTFLLCRSGKDDPAEILRTAELYAPAMVAIEDIDVYAKGGSALEISKLLDMLDGVTNKGVEVVALFTTNHIEDIQKGALRPGRIDAVIEIDDLDQDGFQKLVTLALGEDHLAKDVDWARVSEEFKGFKPAFVKEAASRAQRYTIARNEGVPGVMTTDDLVKAARATRPQLDLMEDAKSGATARTLNDELRTLVEDVLKRTRIDEEYAPFLVDEPTILNGASKS